MIFIVGLGNPGKEYQQTRHNAGFVIADAFLSQHESSSSFKKFNSEISEVSYMDNDILLVKPLTFMNNCGAAVESVVSHYGRSSGMSGSGFTGTLKNATGKNRLLVIHDDMDIEFGKIRLKSGGGTGGHNGLESIAKHIDSTDFDRLRFGLGRPPGRKDPADFVLSNFLKTEKEEFKNMLPVTVEAINDYIINGIDYAMNKYNNL